MGDYVIITGDTVIITPPIDPPAVFTVIPPTLPAAGSSPNLKVRGMAACLPDDIEGLTAAFTYDAPPYVKGAGTVSFELKDGNKSQKTKNSGDPIVIKGGDFTATFEVVTPANDPLTGPDPARPTGTKLDGSASFTTSNSFFKVS